VTASVRRGGVQRSAMKFVPTKIADRRDLRFTARARLISQRTGIINQIRAYCHACTVILPCARTMAETSSQTAHELDIVLTKPQGLTCGMLV
jgi:hypothetical protein